MDAISVLRIFLFFASTYGHISYFSGRTKIKLEFAPAVVFSGIVCILVLSGYLNVLNYSVYIIYFLGLLFLIQCVIRKQLISIFHSCHATFCALFLLIMLVYFAIRLRGARFTSYDDFSHWGVVVKDMLLNNRIPNSQSVVISFKSYPLASSLFIYYVNIMIGMSESKMLFAQMILIIAFVFAFYGVIKSSRKILPQMIIIVASVYMIFGYTDFWCLWVDTLLPLSGIAATAVIFYYRHDVKRAAHFAVPILITSAMIKNSGIMFSLINIILLFYFARRSNRHILLWKERLYGYSYAISALVIVLLSMLLWYSHYNYVFPNIISKHTMSISDYQAVLGDKTLEEITEITSQFISRTLTSDSISSLYFCVVNILTIILSFSISVFFKKRVYAMIHALIFSDIVFVLYMAGMLAMYMLSMPTEEALNLAAYTRYASSAVIYHLGVLTIGYIFVLENSLVSGEVKLQKQIVQSNMQHFICGLCMLIMIIAFGTISIGGNYNKIYYIPDYETTLPASFDQAMVENKKGYSNEKYLVYYATNSPMPSITKSYLGYIARYKLFSASVKVITKFNHDIIMASLPKYDYLIVVEADKAMEDFMSEYVGKKDYQGVYPIKQTFLPSSES